MESDITKTEAKGTIVFLYTELAGYIVSCLNEASKAGYKIHVIHWQVNQEAPFKFQIDQGIARYQRENFSSQQLLSCVASINPDVIFISGWIDKGYMAVGKRFRQNIPVVLVLDNQWQGSLRQYIGIALSRFQLPGVYSHCWVPGAPQKEYARRLGFKDSEIETGFYCADLKYFNDLYKNTLIEKNRNFPKRFLFVGRYLDFKGIFEMWEAFIEFRKSFPEWELWCVGTGDLYDKKVHSEGIRHFGFLQPGELETVIAECGVCIIPSRKEPWGVVVHEFTAAGFPIICSDSVGAASAFLEEGKNGFLHQPGSAAEIGEAMAAMAQKSNDELTEMAAESHRIAQKINPQQWVQTLGKFINQKMYF